MSFSKNDLELIKSKIQISSEIEKKTKLIRKGSDYWCCCLFHEEKTPSCKINDDLGSYYCFGCGAKGDIFTIYTELYNFSFPDAVKELAQITGVNIKEDNYKQNKELEKIYKILEISTNWFHENFKNNNDFKNYLKKRSISNETIKDFRIGYSFNPKISLYNFLKDQNFKDEDIVKSNVVKIDNKNKIRDFFYKRLIFPISNEQNKVVGFGGRVLDNSNPKYINSPESYFFKKRSILYNLNQAKKIVRSKNNILICEGYMDVISLHENKVKSAVAPLGTALTENQLFLAWKHVNKPTIMFDSDPAGLRASFKSALMALPHLSPNKFLQFIKLPNDYDPDSFINEQSFKNFIKILQNPLPIVDFIFSYSSSTIDLSKADNKISYDKYIDDLIQTIKDKKIQYFYKNEFKNLFFNKLKNNTSKSKTISNNRKVSSLIEKEINSFLISYINHADIREQLGQLFSKVNMLSNEHINLLKYLDNPTVQMMNFEELIKLKLPTEISNTLGKLNDTALFSLFPYSKKDHDSKETLSEIEKSIKNLNTRLSNLKKINKSLNEFDNTSSEISWEELKNISANLSNEVD